MEKLTSLKFAPRIWHELKLLIQSFFAKQFFVTNVRLKNANKMHLESVFPG